MAASTNRSSRGAVGDETGASKLGHRAVIEVKSSVNVARALTTGGLAVSAPEHPIATKHATPMTRHSRTPSFTGATNAPRKQRIPKVIPASHSGTSRV
jgi:hypothetical protein